MGNRQELAMALNQQMQGQQGLLNQSPSNIQQQQGGFGTTQQFRQLLGHLAGGGSVTPGGGQGPTGGVGAQSNVFGTHPQILGLQQQLAQQQARMQQGRGVGQYGNAIRPLSPYQAQPQRDTIYDPVNFPNGR